MTRNQSTCRPLRNLPGRWESVTDAQLEGAVQTQPEVNVTTADGVGQVDEDDFYCPPVSGSAPSR